MAEEKKTVETEKKVETETIEKPAAPTIETTEKTIETEKVEVEEKPNPWNTSP